MFFLKRLMISTCKSSHISRLNTKSELFSSVACSRSRHLFRHFSILNRKQQHVIKQLSPPSFHSFYLHYKSCSLLLNNNNHHSSSSSNIPAFKMAAEMTTVKTFERLPKSVVPIHYEIRIKPDLVKLLFEGDETISIKVFNFNLI